MCGIAGCLINRTLQKELINKALYSMKSRGPDNQNIYFEKFSENYLYLLHSRLSIIDLNSRSNQPFKYKNYTVIFNGEIYNFKKLRNELISFGYKFKTQSDTEVLIKSFSHWNVKCFSKFVGMWAIAIWDNKEKKIFLSRDRFGEKPLYYIYNNNELYFASEVQTLKIIYNKTLEVNKKKISDFLFKGYKFLYKDNSTFIKNIKELEGSKYLVFNTKKLIEKKYWFPKYAPDNKLKYQDVVNETQSLIEQSVGRCLISDVPLSIMLSGGIDSAAILGIAKKKFNKDVKSFSIIDKDNRYNELENILLSTKYLKNKNYKIYLNKRSEKNFEDLISLVNYHYKPVLTISSFLSSMLTKKIKSHRIKVNLTGIGADEIFTGYYDHTLYYLNSISKKNFFFKNFNFWKKNYKKNIRNPFLKNENYILKDKYFRSHIIETNKEIFEYSNKKITRNFEEKFFTKNVLRNRMMNECFYETLPILNNQDDLNHMYNSIENRCPFLDRDLVEFLLKVPSEYLMYNGYTKNILRDSCSDYIDKNVVYDTRKRGFNATVQSVFDLKNKNIKNYLLNSKSEIFEYINFDKFEQLLSKKKYLNSESKFIFSAISTMFFLEQIK